MREKERSHSGKSSAFGGRRTKSGGPGAGELQDAGSRLCREARARSEAWAMSGT